MLNSYPGQQYRVLASTLIDRRLRRGETALASLRRDCPTDRRCELDARIPQLPSIFCVFAPAAHADALWQRGDWRYVLANRTAITPSPI